MGVISNQSVIRSFSCSSSQLITNLPNSVFFYTQFIGMPAKSVSRRSFLLYPYLRVVSEEEECSVVLKSVDSLSLEHIYAIMVEYCLSIGKQRDPGAVPFPVLSVPSFVSSSFLRNISYAMQITGTQQYATLQASLAVALDFSYYLNKDGWFASYSPSRPFSFLLVDVGFFSTECSLFLFWPDHVERVAFNYRMDCGGDRCTWVIFSLLSDAYARFVGPFPEMQSKTLLAYYVMAEGVKHDLSLKGLNETTVFIEDEHSLTITAAEVDKAICEEGLLEDTLECVYACIKDVALPAVDRIECVGGASRAPYVKKAVEAACSKKGWAPNFTYTLNADEACAGGCTLYAMYKAAPEECTEKALLQCFEQMNVPPAATEDMFVSVKEEVVEEGRTKEEALRAAHSDYEKRAAMVNQIEEQLLTFQREMETLALEKAEKAAIQSRIDRIVRELMGRGMTYSLLQFAFLEGVVRLFINRYNGKAEALEVFRLEGLQRRHIRKGVFRNGRLEGRGCYYDKDEQCGVETKYEGEFRNGEKSGRGETVESSPDMVVFEAGEYEKDRLVAGKRVEFRLKEGVKIETVVGRGEPAQSCVWNARGEVLYRGGMWKGKKEGFGISYYANGGKQYEGLYRCGLREGEGVSYSRQGVVQYRGRWHQDEIENGAWTVCFHHIPFVLLAIEQP